MSLLWSLNFKYYCFVRTPFFVFVVFVLLFLFFYILFFFKPTQTHKANVTKKQLARCTGITI